MLTLTSAETTYTSISAIHLIIISLNTNIHLSTLIKPFTGYKTSYQTVNILMFLTIYPVVRSNSTVRLCKISVHLAMIRSGLHNSFSQ